MTREELRKHCERQIRVCETWSKATGVPKGKVYDEYRLILELLDNEHKVKVGKWIRWHEEITTDNAVIEYKPHCKCSECNKEYDSYSTLFMNYCPNCGARMEKEVK